MKASRLEKTIKNAKVSVLFLVAVLLATFFSRAVFIRELGSDFVGLSTTMMNIMGFLNLAEMGFASVVAFALYRPIREESIEEIKEITSVFSFIYFNVGAAVAVIGIIIAFFIPAAFKSAGFSFAVVMVMYFTYLTTTVMGFFLNYSEVLLVADQKNYIKISIFNGLKLVKLALQVVAVMFLQYKIFSWVALEFLALLAYSLLLNVKVRKIYPHIAISRSFGRSVSKKYSIIYTKSKQAFTHKFATVVLQQTSPIFVFFFSNLGTVTKYTNYTIITSAVVMIVSAIFDSTNAGVGNLVAEKNEKKITNVFWELQASRFWLSGLVAYTAYASVDVFIAAWVGPNFILERVIVFVLFANLFLTIARKTTDEFLSAYGMYNDTWAPIAEAVINIGIVLIAGKIYGVLGIALGAFCSMISIVGVWKPIFLFRDAFRLSPWIYFRSIVGYLFILCFSAACMYFIPVISIWEGGFLKFVVLSIQRFVCFGVISLTLFLCFSQGMRDFIKRFRRHFS